ncbi:pentatricopeptide repeat-containing protein At5g66520 [Ziziphus jujuba]|uniref:Pentatricopeptide repeat-containing protein At5g66520 n=1 Tax=Ziziphus jujuba TaxID=326968 RepID=A0A6P4AV53_ZIZJJ|nr:pentatricopeptide repeat-containing protein At5g66520 [Ziziphus jujuba]
MTPLLSPTNQFLESNMAQTVSLLESCSSMEELKQIHAQMFKTGLVSSSIPVSKLLSFCSLSSSGNLGYACKVFDRFSSPNIFMWNIMIRGYSNSNEPEKALLLYHQMLRHSVSHNEYTFPFLLKACSCLSALEETHQIHAHILKLGFGSEVYAMNSLLHVYAITGSIRSANLLFDRIPERDIVTWNSIIKGYTKYGEMEKANEFFRSMPVKNIISWTAMISGYVSAGLSKEALNLFHEMQSAGVKPDKVTLASALSACARLGALDQGSWIHTYIDKNRIRIDQVLGCALIDMYAKCGSMEEALEVFKSTEKKNVSLWTAVIDGFGIHGQGRDALDWFMQMLKEGIEPNAITFVAILTACSHAGLVNEGKSLFQSMNTVYKLKPSIEHYGCMVDLLGRAGLLKEAKELIERMPLRPNAVIWGALLNACRVHKHLELGKQVGKLLVEEDPAHGGRYIHLASIHAAAGEWNQAVKVRRQMEDQGISKIPGCSVISLNGNVHQFIAGDGSHEDMKEIYHMWERIATRLRQEGYKPATEDLLLDLEDEEKETAIQQHSEKLAVSFGLIGTKPGAVIRIFKNLRICEDCHKVAKLISDIYDRDILLRDRVRFHLFRKGKCSCGDYW